MKKIGEQIKEFRKEKGLTQEELAKLVGNSKPYLSKIEAGNQNISLLLLGKIAAAVGKEPRELIK